MKSERRDCENCKFWRRGDPIEEAANVGVCLFMLQRGSDSFAYPKHVPFWAHEALHRTVSWEGRGCPTWERAPQEE